jgi:nitroreductase
MSQDAATLTEFLRSLRAVREYTSEPVSDDDVGAIVEVGRWSGSASNNQTTELVIVTDPAVKQKLTEGGVRAAAGSAVSLVIVTPGDAQRHDLEVFDEGRLVERLLLAASARGLGANVGTLKGDGPRLIRDALRIPTNRRVWTVVTIGHTDEAAFGARTRNPRAGRKPVSEFAHRERYAGAP